MSHVIHITAQEFKAHCEPLDEPATSTITYTYGEGNEEMVLSFPTITFCDLRPDQFIADCNLTYEQQVESGLGTSDAKSWTFQELLLICLKSNISLDLDNLLVKLQVRLDSAFDLIPPTPTSTPTPTVSASPEDYLYKMQAILSDGQSFMYDPDYQFNFKQTFNPHYGYCRTLNPESKIDGSSTKLRLLASSLFQNLKKEDLEYLSMFIHDDESMHPNMNVIFHESDHYTMSLRKRRVSQSSLDRSPCAKDNYWTCRYEALEKHLDEQYNCSAPLLGNVNLLNDMTTISETICSNPILLQVRIMHFLILFESNKTNLCYLDSRGF